MIDAQLALVLVIVELRDCRPEITLNIALVKFQWVGAAGGGDGWLCCMTPFCGLPIM